MDMVDLYEMGVCLKKRGILGAQGKQSCVALLSKVS